jgi:hypothetical protein
MSFYFIDRKFGQKKATDALKTPWWCDDCQKEIDGRDVTFQERHDERAGGCGCTVYLACDTCSNTGWCDQWLGGHALIDQWCECPDCHNPFNRTSPS